MKYSEIDWIEDSNDGINSEELRREIYDRVVDDEENILGFEEINDRLAQLDEVEEKFGDVNNESFRVRISQLLERELYEDLYIAENMETYTVVKDPDRITSVLIRTDQAQSKLGMRIAEPIAYIPREQPNTEYEVEETDLSFTDILSNYINLK